MPGILGESDRVVNRTPEEILATCAGAKLSRRAQKTGTVVTLYDGVEADLDTEGGRWQTVCEDHGWIVSHSTRKLAASHLSHPEEWCEECQAVAL